MRALLKPVDLVAEREEPGAAALAGNRGLIIGANRRAFSSTVSEMPEDWTATTSAILATPVDRIGEISGFEPGDRAPGRVVDRNWRWGEAGSNVEAGPLRDEGDRAE